MEGSASPASCAACSLGALLPSCHTRLPVAPASPAQGRIKFVNVPSTRCVHVAPPALLNTSTTHCSRAQGRIKFVNIASMMYDPSENEGILYEEAMEVRSASGCQAPHAAVR